MNALETSVPTTAYHFVDKWRVKGDVKEVADIIDDALSLPRWWPAVYFEVKELAPSGEDGVGRVISLRAAGWLPYSSAWQSSRPLDLLSQCFNLCACVLSAFCSPAWKPLASSVSFALLLSREPFAAGYLRAT